MCCKYIHLTQIYYSKLNFASRLRFMFNKIVPVQKKRVCFCSRNTTALVLCPGLQHLLEALENQTLFWKVFQPYTAPLRPNSNVADSLRILHVDKILKNLFPCCRLFSCGNRSMLQICHRYSLQISSLSTQQGGNPLGIRSKIYMLYSHFSVDLPWKISAMRGPSPTCRLVRDFKHYQGIYQRPTFHNVFEHDNKIC